jgi:thiosulfate/3-mercaptopyruvate sulfurtransferase
MAIIDRSRIRELPSVLGAIRAIAVPSVRGFARHIAIGVVAIACVVVPTSRGVWAQSAGATRSQRLVATSWLAAHLRDPDLVLLHVGPPTFAKGHIPGAREIDFRDVSANATGGAHHDSALMVEMLPPEILRANLERYGISDRSRVVVYGVDDWAAAATRVLYTLEVAGLGPRAALLDGGFTVWKAEGREVSTETLPVRSGTITATPVRSLVVDAEWVQSHMKHRSVVLIDARARSFYDGVEQGASRLGHIPTAQSIPFSSVLDERGKLRTASELHTLFASAGAAPGDTIVAYCHVGIQATQVLFAAETLGYTVRLYDGSFEDWARRRDLPVDNPSVHPPSGH